MGADENSKKLEEIEELSQGNEKLKEELAEARSADAAEAVPRPDASTGEVDDAKITELEGEVDALKKQISDLETQVGEANVKMIEQAANHDLALQKEKEV